MLPKINTTVIVLVDVQEKFIPAIKTLNDFVCRQQMVLKAAKELMVPVVVTEQYPDGLGETIEPLKALFSPEWPVFEKTTFSCFGSSQFRSELKKKKINSVAIMGIETHVCILQTACDALESGYDVWVLNDTVTSRKESDRQTALNFMRHKGCNLVSSESFLFMLMRDAKHPAFKAVSKLVK